MPGMDVLHLSGLLAGDVKESRNDNPTRDLQMASDRTRPHSFVRYGGIFAILCRCAMLRNCWKSAVSMSITQQSGAGCRITARSWCSDCEGISSRQTSRGEWTKPTFACRVADATCIGPSIPRVPPSISCCHRSVTPMLPSACFARRSAIDPILNLE